jgi:hypothetical protein
LTIIDFYCNILEDFRITFSQEVTVNKTQSLQISLTPELLTRIRRLARREGLSLAAFGRRAIIEDLARREGARVEDNGHTLVVDVLEAVNGR